jgi:hypothetical protein
MLRKVCRFSRRNPYFSGYVFPKYIQTDHCQGMTTGYIQTRDGQEFLLSKGTEYKSGA